MTEVTKLSVEELEVIKDLRTRFSEIITRRGEIHFELRLLNKELDIIDGQFDQLKESETQLMQSLQEKYGQGYIDLDSGAFQPQQA